jgi:hypothetical protein
MESERKKWPRFFEEHQHQQMCHKYSGTDLEKASSFHAMLEEKVVLI